MTRIRGQRARLADAYQTLYPYWDRAYALYIARNALRQVGQGRTSKQLTEKEPRTGKEEYNVH